MSVIMCERCVSVSAAYFLLVTLAFTNAFNLNWNYAPVFQDASPGSYFGYSVAFRKDGSQYKLLVGAPKGIPKVTDAGFSNQLLLDEPGVVFQCNLNNGWGCSLLQIETSGNKPQNLPNLRDGVYHKRDRSMFGGAMVVNDDETRTVVCAPKWKNSKYEKFYLMNGICYCSDNPNNYRFTQYVMPLIRPDLQSVTDSRINEIVFNYAYGEAGFTVHFPKNSSDLILGAPGIFDWKGGVIKYKGHKSNCIYEDPQIPSFIYTEPTILGRNNYLGYAIDSGKFSRTDVRTSYVSSAPRGSLYKGKVLIFDFPKNGENEIIINNILEGKQMGEYFGASLCVADINGDGLDDLVVGAPQYSLSSLNAAQTIGDEGCIYVYINEDFGNMREATGENRIMGRRKSGARFGTAIANVGDLNYDGTEDIAVGAPYEENGVIYIYHGRKSGVPLEKVQVIEAKNINPLIKGLGISFSKGLDIDSNHYNDIAAGAYESGHAVILRGHPIITFTPTLKSDVQKISNLTNSFTVTACLRYDAKYPPEKVDVVTEIKVDNTYGRARIGDSSENVRILTWTITKQKDKCENLQIKIKGENKDPSKPVDIIMTYNLKFDPADQKPTFPNSNPEKFCRDCPVVDINQSKSQSIKVPFETGCKTLICKPDLQVSAKFLGVKDKLILGEHQTLEMLVEVQNNGEPAFQPQVMIILPMYTPVVRYPPNCQNVPDVKRPENHILSCEVGNSLSKNKTIKLRMDLKDVPSRLTQLVYEINATSSGEEATPNDNYLSAKLDVDVLFDLTISGVSSREQIVYVSQNNTILKELNVTHTFEVWNSGPTRVDVAEIVFEIPYYYYINNDAKPIIGIHKERAVLHNNGNSELQKCTLDPKYSYYQKSNNTNIYENNIIGGNIEPQEVFRENSDNSSSSSHRRKRSAEIKENKYLKITPQTPLNKTLFINCGNQLLDCATITCIVGPFYANKSRAIIDIPLTLLNIDALGEELESKDIILVSTRGSVTSKEPSNDKQPEGHRPDEVVVQTTFLGKVNVSDEGIPTWIIAVAIICGLLILCLIALGLHKMGFFKREKKDELEALKEAEAEADADAEE